MYGLVGTPPHVVPDAIVHADVKGADVLVAGVLLSGDPHGVLNRKC